MEERYRGIYSEIYDARTGDGTPLLQSETFVRLRRFSDDLIPGVRSAISRSGRLRDVRDGARLREDAKALLAVNFQELVLVPLLAAERVRSNEIREAVSHDIQLLVSRAEASSAPAPEISGHRIIDSLSRNWGRLSLSSFNLWEDPDAPSADRPTWQLR
jgi:hypothetical protein